MSEPITLHYFELTVLVFLGAGLGVYFGWVYVVPFLKRRANMIDFGEKRDVDSLFQGRLAKLFFRIFGIKAIRKAPVHPKWFAIYYMGAFGVAFLVLFIWTGELLTSVGWVSPFTANGLAFDLIFARANGLPNGSHLPSFLSVAVLCWIGAVKFRDGVVIDLFQGALCGLLLVAVHEGIWMGFYYLNYGALLAGPEFMPYVVIDLSFETMVLLFVLAFLRYPMKKIDLSAFKWPTLIFVGYLVAWMFVPALPGYGFFPITTINNFKYGMGQYNETVYFPSMFVNAIESAGWVFPAAMFAIAILRSKGVVATP